MSVKKSPSRSRHIQVDNSRKMRVPLHRPGAKLCHRCFYRWESRIARPLKCPRCGDPNYMTQYVRKTKGKRVMRQGASYHRQDRPAAEKLLRKSWGKFGVPGLKQPE